MISLLRGWGKRPFALSGQWHYTPERLLAMAERSAGPLWLRVDGRDIRVERGEPLWLACQVAAAYHNSIAYNAPPDDGFQREIQDIERRVQAHMEDPSESTDEDYVTDEEDMEYRNIFYI